MTLDEQIEKSEQDLAHFIETNQWWAAANALDTIEKLIKVRGYLETSGLTIEIGRERS